MKKVFNYIAKVISGLFSRKGEEQKVTPEVETSEQGQEQNSKKAFWKFIIQTVINVLAAVLTALGATSCI